MSQVSQQNTQIQMGSFEETTWTIKVFFLKNLAVMLIASKIFNNFK